MLKAIKGYRQSSRQQLVSNWLATAQHTLVDNDDCITSLLKPTSSQAYQFHAASLARQLSGVLALLRIWQCTLASSTIA